MSKSLSHLAKISIVILFISIGGVCIYYIWAENLKLQWELLFGLWILVQCLFILISDFRWSLWRVATAFLTSLFWFLPWRNEENYTLDSHLFLSYMFFIFFFTGFFSKKILIKISETNLFIFLVVSLYIFIYRYSIFNPFLAILLWASFIVSIIWVIYSAFTRTNSEREKTLFYSIYAFLILFLCFFQISWSNYSLFFDNTLPQSLNYLEVFSGGMLLCYAGMYISYFIRLIPLQTKDETKSEFQSRIKEYRTNLIASFSDRQISYIDMFVISLVAITFIWINYYYIHYSDGVTISIFFIVSAIISYYEERKRNESIQN